jgi:hypothetical protein
MLSRIFRHCGIRITPSLSAITAKITAISAMNQ